MSILLRRYYAVSAVLVILVATGCRGGWSHRFAKDETFAAPTTILATTSPRQLAPKTEQLEGKSQEDALAEVLGELTELGALEPAAKSQLMADLREAKPENWSLIVRQFRSALAYSKQLAEREQQAASSTVASLSVEPAQNLSQPKLAITPEVEPQAKPPVDSRPKAIAVSYDARQALTTKQPPQASPVIQDAPQTQAAVSNPPLVLTGSPHHTVQQLNYTVPPQGSPTDWRHHLQTAITDLQTSVQPSPGSTDEVNEHLRLRLLQLLAGNEESALQPIPGATAPQQDYWNQQLFAVSTFLDSQQQPDDKRRAAGSLMHLDQARAKLAQLATLQVRKLAFVKSVQGYGAYEVRDEAKFKPGEEITLYAEIENFSSESTKEGYRTRLGTSYEVLDSNGKRVDSDQFPEVEDVCLNTRRDFHMQYTVTLPTRIYPDQYELRLIITDQQSHKIGQASLKFEISE